MADFIKNHRNKIYILVNKFDENNSNGLERKETCAYVKGLFADPATRQSPVDEANIYPVSAQKAYLANRMRLALKSGETLDFGHTDKSWLNDFGESAYSTMWEEFREEWQDKPDLDRIKKSWERMWDKSAFQKPLDEVIARGYRDAAFHVLASGVEKLKVYHGDLEAAVHDRITTLQDSESGLRNEMENIERQIATLDGQFEATREKGAKALQSLQKDIEDRFWSIKATLQEEIQDYFTKGKLEERERKADVNDKETHARKNKKASSALSWSGIFKLHGTEKGEKEADFDPDKPEIEFTSRGEARKFMDKIEERIEDICRHSQDEFEKMVNDQLENMEDMVLVPMVEEARNSLEDFADKLEKKGYRIKFSIPSPATFRLRLNIEEFLDKAIEEDPRTEKRSRRQKNIWGWICEKFDTDDWGWEDYYVEKTYYKVYLNQLSQSASESLKKLNLDMGGAIQDQIAASLEEKVNAFYGEFRIQLEDLIHDFQNAINDKKNMQENIQKHIDFGRRMEKELDNFGAEIAGLIRRSEDILNVQ